MIYLIYYFKLFDLTRTDMPEEEIRKIAADPKYREDHNLLNPLLNEADVVLYDYLTHKDILKHAQKAELIYTGKRKGHHSITQDNLNRKIKEEVFKGKMVVRLKCGDPLIFGRGSEEIAYLSDYHIDVHVIPGVSAATGIPSLLGMPLTARDVSNSVSFISAHTKEEKSTEAEGLPEIQRGDHCRQQSCRLWPGYTLSVSESKKKGKDNYHCSRKATESRG